MCIIGLLSYLNFEDMDSQQYIKCNSKRERDSDTASRNAKRFCHPLPDLAGFPEDPDAPIFPEEEINSLRYSRDGHLLPSQIESLKTQNYVPKRLF